MTLELNTTNRFLKSLKKQKKRGKDLTKMKKVINLLQNQSPLPYSLRDHSLVGNYIGYRDCHIEPDWILIYTITEKELVLADTGSHSDLFK